MDGKEFIKALKNMAKDLVIDEDYIFASMEQALITAYKKNFHSKSNVKVEINKDTTDSAIQNTSAVTGNQDQAKQESTTVGLAVIPDNPSEPPHFIPIISSLALTFSRLKLLAYDISSDIIYSSSFNTSTINLSLS